MDVNLTEEHIKLINIIEQFFNGAVPEGATPLLYTTSDIFAKAQSVYPSENYTVEHIYNVLTYLNFEFINSSDRGILWMMSVQQ